MIKQFLIGTIQSGHDEFLRTFSAVPDDQLSWKPLDNGKSALELLFSTAQVMKMVQQLVESKGEIKPSRETFQRMAEVSAGWSKQDALGHLETNHSGLIAALESVDESELGKPITMDLGGGMTMPLAAWTMMAYRTYISRFGQINYIQTLYGDFEPH
jgi:hypothetical protein